MEKEIYTPMEQALIKGVQILTRQEYSKTLLNLIEMEMEMLMQDMEGAIDAN